MDKSQQHNRLESDLYGTVSLHCFRESLGTVKLLIFKATMDGETHKRTKMGRSKRHEGLKVDCVPYGINFPDLERHEERVVTGGPCDDKQ